MTKTPGAGITRGLVDYKGKVAAHQRGAMQYRAIGLA